MGMGLTLYICVCACASGGGVRGGVVIACEVTLSGVTDFACEAEGRRGRLSAFAAACPEAVERPPLIARPPQQHIVCPSENFTFSLRSLGKNAGNPAVGSVWAPLGG